MLVTERFFSTSFFVTVKATHCPSGETRGFPTRERRCMSSTWKGWAAQALKAKEHSASEQMRDFNGNFLFGTDSGIIPVVAGE
jgi:hypothetical protein